MPDPFDIIEAMMMRIEGRQMDFRLAGKSLIILSVFLLIAGWLLATPAGLIGKADAIGYAVCHRIDARSFHLGDRQMPLCARCSGMFLGALLGLGVQFATASRRAGMPRWQYWVVLGVFAFAFALDGINSYLHLFPGAPVLYEPSNLGRLVTGTGMGLFVAFLIFPAFNQTVWRFLDFTPVLNHPRTLIFVVGMALVMIWLVWIENAFLLFLFALLSALGVLVLLVMIYTVFWLMLLKRDNRCERFSQLAFPLVLGLGTAVGQIALFNLVRYFLIGTWDGFQIG